MNCFWASLLFALAAMATRPIDRNEPVVVPIRISAVSTTQPVVALDRGSQGGVTTHDLVFAQASARQIRRGNVIVASAKSSAAQLAGSEPLAANAQAVVLKVDTLGSLCRFMPPEATIRGHIARLPPGRTTAWVDIGRLAGLQLNDTLLVRRRTMMDNRPVLIPIARGKVQLLEDHTSLMELEPLVGNAVTEMDDSVELWPAPGQARLGRVNTSVLTIKRDAEGDILTIAGSQEDGFIEARMLDLWRGTQFIGVAAVSEPSTLPRTFARTIKVASPDTPREGDIAVLRAPAGPPAQPLIAPIFRIEGNYCLIAAGEVDGVQKGEKLRVFRTQPDSDEFTPAYEITIEKVEISYAGGYARELDATAEKLRVWEMAEREKPPWPRWTHAGIVSSVDATARVIFADIDPKCGIKPGELLELAPGPESPIAAAVVLWRTSDRCIATLPDGWGDVATLEKAQVLMRDTGEKPPGTTKPAK